MCNTFYATKVQANQILLKLKFNYLKGQSITII